MKIFTLVLTAAFFSTTASAQILPPKSAPVIKDSTGGDAPADFTVGDVRGSVNSKAIHLAKPVYSPEARAAGAEGAARVQITISEEGNVTAAKMVEGNPLFAAAAEDAARKSRFRIARDAGGNPIPAEGFLTYNFVVQKANWSRIAYGLNLLEQLPAASFSIASAKKAFAPEWTNELAMLGRLDEIRRAEPASPSSPFEDVPQLVSSGGAANGKGAASATVVRRLYVPPAPNAEQIALSQNLISALQARLGGDALGAWQFNLGLDLRRALETQRDPNARLSAAQIIRQNIETAPPKAAPETLAALENLAQVFERQEEAMDSLTAIRKYLNTVFNAKP